MANFDSSYAHTCRNEGGYTLDPHETWMGIDRVEVPGWHGWAIVDSMKKQGDFPRCLSKNQDLLNCVKEFFKASYWQPVRGDDITDQGVADKLYDAGVNMGTGTAVRLMQEALHLVVDGVIGPKTVGAINGTSPADVLAKFKDVRVAHYEKIAENSPEDRKYLASWISRC